MAATPAHLCKRALSDATRRWPSRSRVSDGIMGDARHQKTKSDHNLGNAFDVSHDPASGCEGGIIAAIAIVDERVKYVIWNRHIFNRERGDGIWRAYHGKNGHTHHCHVSILASQRDNDRPWGWAPEGLSTLPAPVSQVAGPHPHAGGAAHPPAHRPAGSGAPVSPSERRAHPGTMLRRGARGELVSLVQTRLYRLEWEITVDGVFGHETEHVVRSFQQRRGIEDDGIVGRHTWRLLFG